MPVSVVAFLVGFVSGLRAVTGPAVVSWAARLGWIDLEQTPFGFLSHKATPVVMTTLALAEMVTDKLPSTPSRTVPLQFGVRMAAGGFAGAAVGAARDEAVVGSVCGMIGTAIGTLAGAQARAEGAHAFGEDLPAALIEDCVAVATAFLSLSRGVA